jgi:hypothetical protein
MEMGVPQGSCLAPLLYLLYANDMNYLIDDLKMTMFADDTVVLEIGDDPISLSDRLNTNLCVILDWCNFCKLSLNANKTKCMMFGYSRGNIPDILIDANQVEVVKTFKYLGFNLDCKLNYRPNYHFKYLKSKMASLKYVTYRIKGYLSCQASYSFYHAMVQSILCYGIVCIWGSSLVERTNFKRLESLHDRIVYNLFSLPGECRNNMSGIYKRSRIVKLVDLYRVKTCVLVYQILNENTMYFLREKLLNLTRTHDYETRNRHAFLLPYPRVLSIKLNFLYQAAKLWNNLNDDIKLCTSSSILKKTYTNFILNNY